MITRYRLLRIDHGVLGIAGSERGLALVTTPQESEEKASSCLAGCLPREAVEDATAFPGLVKQLRLYFSGQPVKFDVRLDYGKASPFKRHILELVRGIPWGETRTYGWLANNLGFPKASRAVGQAVGANPFPIVVPCHRVVASGGGLGGYTGGLERKRSLLRLEGVDLPLLTRKPLNMLAV